MSLQSFKGRAFSELAPEEASYVAAKLSRRLRQDDQTGCWEWQGPCKEGYGVMQARGKNWNIHRLSYEVTHGPIGDGMTIDHLCRNRACANPSHLEAVSRSENSKRMLAHVRSLGLGSTGSRAYAEWAAANPSPQRNIRWAQRFG